MEGSATWVEDVVYDNINDNYQYLPTSPIRHPRTSLDYSGGGYPYGSFIFFTYATARHGAATVRRFWDWRSEHRTSLQAIRAVIGASPGRRSSPRSGAGTRCPRTATRSAPDTRAPLVAAEDADPGSGHHGLAQRRHPAPRQRGHAGRAGQARAGAQAPAGHHRRPPEGTGTAALLQRRFRNGRVTHTMITLGANGNGRTLVQFNRRVLSSIAVVVANTNRYGRGTGVQGAGELCARRNKTGTSALYMTTICGRPPRSTPPCRP